MSPQIIFLFNFFLIFYFFFLPAGNHFGLHGVLLYVKHFGRWKKKSSGVAAHNFFLFNFLFFFIFFFLLAKEILRYFPHLQNIFFYIFIFFFLFFFLPAGNHFGLHGVLLYVKCFSSGQKKSSHIFLSYGENY